ncbi:MAG: Ku protein [Stellaceae bacterium]
MAAPRPYWKGYLKLSLVSCPIAVYAGASSGERVAFRMINHQTGHRLRQQYVDEVTREVVEGADKARGYEYAKNAYVVVEDAELDAIAIASTHTIEIDKFVPRAQIDERYFETPYYIAPDDPVGQEAFAVIREAMRGKSMVALARIVMARRERVMMLQPWENGLLGISLRYGAEVRPAKDYFADIAPIEVPAEMQKLAEHILDTKAADFDPGEFVDRYEEAVAQMLKQKQAGLPIPAMTSEPRAPNVINLMDALKRSVAADRNGEQPAAKRGKSKKRLAGQGEMLLPITGKRGPDKAKAKAKAKEKPAARPAGRQKKAG